ncbi:XRE family transcriptional regulator [Bifidobacterium pseudolongum subsp. globosum]|nr:helix-turn-helix transcriptional regulator [Bifidobacterium pseudolongum]RYQ43573.1 XRE family transcriptional regulator [Bifidobacterium pseudolongum subsp. globosum]
MSNFKTNLQYLRAQRNMTQEQLAMLLGVSRQAISNWESDNSTAGVSWVNPQVIHTIH